MIIIREMGMENIDLILRGVRCIEDNGRIISMMDRAFSVGKTDVNLKGNLCKTGTRG